MNIITSTFTLSGRQKDGRVYCTERHEGDGGEGFTVTYLADPAANFAGIMALRKVILQAQENQRIAEVIEELAVRLVEKKVWQYLDGQTDNALKVQIGLLDAGIVRLRKLILEKK